LGIHAPFYNQINEALMLNTDEFYLSYVDDPVLKERMEFIESQVSTGDDLISIGAFSMVEGAVLYSAFAFLKHFQARGKNKLSNVVRGINFSVRDENLHCEAGAWLYHTLKHEMLEAKTTTPEAMKGREKLLENVAKTIWEHESYIIDMIFEKGGMEGIKKEDMKTFVKSRLNLCLQHLGINPIFEIDSNPIAEWFYKDINLIQFNDLFTGIGSEYNRDWNEQLFIWKTEEV
jgi:ribonucleotide reductase beta subunit family protein with ferritin-like domain